MKRLLQVLMFVIPSVCYSQNAIYLNLGTNLYNFYGGLSMGADFQESNFRFNLNANIVQREVEELEMVGYQLEPAIAYKFQGDGSNKPFVSIGGFLFNPISRNNKELDIKEVDAGLMFSVGLIEEKRSLAVEYSQGLINVLEGEKSMYVGLIFRIPVSKPFF